MFYFILPAFFANKDFILHLVKNIIGSFTVYKYVKGAFPTETGFTS
jgi:hypothetical protein